jgi:glycerol-3-phosphate responsive antiterminator
VTEPAGPAPGLPRVLLSGHDHAGQASPAGAGLLVHDVNLVELVRISAHTVLPLAVDLDTVEGLAADETAVEFLRRRLGVAIVITKRAHLAARAPELGCLGLLHVHCLDSTGLERAMNTHPGAPVGTAVSPGLILTDLTHVQRRQLPRPLLAYGLLRGTEELDAALAAGADGVVVSSRRR